MYNNVIQYIPCPLMTIAHYNNLTWSRLFIAHHNIVILASNLKLRWARTHLCSARQHMSFQIL